MLFDSSLDGEAESPCTRQMSVGSDRSLNVVTQWRQLIGVVDFEGIGFSWIRFVLSRGSKDYIM